MAEFPVKIWLAAVKWPLTFFFNRFVLRRTRLRATPAFAAWATAAAAGGPPAIATAVKTRVRYANDPFGGLLDYVAAPEVTWARGWGDCDDFSYLTAEVLRRAGVECWIATYVCWNVKDSHVVCLFRLGERYALLDQGELRMDLASLAEAAREARPTATVAAQYVRPYLAEAIGRWFSRPPVAAAKE
ncbi:MAG: hypothetical protein JSU81_06025 [Candidatus Coatesbacteria bacterium]|nr:MAG: hypothetical protein JSU81_06025 [Candidatus Coatesbacteria bacterium]